MPERLATLGQPVDYDAIDDNSDVVLRHFRTGEIEKIFNFDFSEKALVMKYENFLPEYAGLEKMREYLRGQDIHHFRDVINIISLWRPHAPEILDRLEIYRKAKRHSFRYSCLSAEVQRWLEPNFGLMIYHEDLLRIIAHYSGAGLAHANVLRKICKDGLADSSREWGEFKKLAPPGVAELVREESKWAFCMSHSVAFARLTKQTAVLKSLHPRVYAEEIEKFQNKHGFTWDDIGIRIKGVSLLQN